MRGGACYAGPLLETPQGSLLVKHIVARELPHSITTRICLKTRELTEFTRFYSLAIRSDYNPSSLHVPNIYKGTAEDSYCTSGNRTGLKPCKFTKFSCFETDSSGNRMG